jgi:PQQ-dependent dehydrogenase (methanol/ethanol family)
MLTILRYLTLVLLGLGGAATAIGAADVRNTDWTMLGGNAEVWHYSALNQINANTVKDLGLAWLADIPSKDGLVGNPLVANGVVFQSGPLGRIYANDLRTGKLLWRFTPEVKFDDKTSLATFWSSRYNRGLALFDDNVYVASGDCRLFAVNQKTGKEVWHAVSCDSTKAFGITGAPRVGGGKVFIGNNCIDSGAERGYVDAFDAKTGKKAWRFYTMPGDPKQPFESKTMEMASKTWGTDYWTKTHGCVSAYDAMTYDEKLGLLYIGTGSGSPWSPAERAKDAGDELFSDSIVAVKADSGEYVWHYQTVQHDGWDFDATWQISIAELPIKGASRRVLITAPKNGFLYVIDAKTGRFLSGKNYTPVTWASGIDPKTGRPIVKPEARYWEHPGKEAIVSPGPLGAHNWQANSFSPITGLIYLPVIIAPTLMQPNPAAKVGGFNFNMYYGESGDPKWKSGGELVAWDPVTQTARWRVKRLLPMNGGTLSTAGNLVFQGTAEGTLDAFAADTGNKLWTFDTHGSIQAAPTTVEVDGEQVILVASGNAGSAAIGPYLARYSTTPASRAPSRLLAFKLGGKGVVPQTVVNEFPMPPLPRPALDAAKRGGVLFEAEFCTDCHGLGVEDVRSSIPDLRMASALTHQQFFAILAGARRDKGMPAFPGIPADEVQLIQAYILSEAWNAYDAQEAYKAKQAAH